MSKKYLFLVVRNLKTNGLSTFEVVSGDDYLFLTCVAVF